MKTAVSLPDSIFEAAEHLAKRMRVSRSRLYAEAIRIYVADARGRGVTERLNEVYGPRPGDSELDPVIAKLQLRSVRKADK